MTNIEAIIATCLTQQGDPYIWGFEANPADADPDAFDCSELIEWACKRNGVHMPDGSGNQYAHSKAHGTIIPTRDGPFRRGALLHRFDPGRGNWGHVALSLGNNTTIEARGTKWGVGVFTANNRGWDAASTIPNVDYGPAQLPSPGVPDGAEWRSKFRYLNGQHLTQGSRGREVAELQFLLNVLNGANSMHAIAVDGVYGVQTRVAVRRFQTIYDMWVAPILGDGMYGPATHHALMVALNKRGIW